MIGKSGVFFHRLLPFEDVNDDVAVFVQFQIERLSAQPGVVHGFCGKALHQFQRGIELALEVLRVVFIRRVERRVAGGVRHVNHADNQRIGVLFVVQL